MVAPGVYSKMTLNDNWFEDRAQPPDALTATGSFHKRGPRAVETDLAYIGERYDVLARISRMPPRTTFASPDDGFNEKKTTSQIDFADPRKHPMFAVKKQSAPSLINIRNAPVQHPDKRPLPGPESGFGAHLSRHPPTHDQRFFNTTYGDFHCYGLPRSPRALPAEPSGKHPAGVSTEHEENRTQGMKCGQLCGESHCVSTDPGKDSKTQRAWLPGGDPALANVHLGGSRTCIPAEDNHLSLPLGGGAMSKVRADLKERKGRLYRTATHITKGPHMTSGVRVFADFED